MDEEERIGEDYSPDRGFPLEDDDDRHFMFHEDQIASIEDSARRRRIDDDDEDDFEDSDSDDEHHPRRTFKQRLDRTWKWIKQFVLPNPSATTAALENPQAVISGPVYARHFKAPPGKRSSPTFHDS